MSTNRGYILFETLIAITIFALAAGGLIKILHASSETANMFARDNTIRYGLQAILSEARHRDRGDMDLEYTDELLGVTYRTEIDRLELQNAGGSNLKDLNRLTATATYAGVEGDEEDSVEIWVYKPREDR